MKVIFIVPFRNAKQNLDTLINSLTSQTNDSWECHFVDDMSDDESEKWFLNSIYHSSKKFTYHRNSKRMHALFNIVKLSRTFEDHEDKIIAVIDGDDSLCNDKTVDYLIESYNKGNEVVWTSHKWDINGMNISYDLPQNLDPYFLEWASSHLRTFKSSLLKNIKDENFKDLDGNWFKRGYDQALMLPLIKTCKSHEFIDKVCYKYNINSVSMPSREWAERDQLNTINLVRARGFIK